MDSCPHIIRIENRFMPPYAPATMVDVPHSDSRFLPLSSPALIFLLDAVPFFRFSTLRPG